MKELRGILDITRFITKRMGKRFFIGIKTALTQVKKYGL